MLLLKNKRPTKTSLLISYKYFALFKSNENYGDNLLVIPS